MGTKAIKVLIFLVTNILHTATGLELHLILPLRNIFLWEM